MKIRGSGILMHISSLPSDYGIGDLGPGAFRFADFLSDTKQRYWQILPLTPTSLSRDNSPYHTSSAFACNRILISPEGLVQDGFLNPSDLEPMPDFPADRVDYLSVTTYKEKLFSIAYHRFKQKREDFAYGQFCKANSFWLENAALFWALDSQLKEKAWSDWAAPIRDRQPETLDELRREFRESVGKETFLQYVFSKQWFALKAHCNEKNIKIIGDLPIYVDYGSADVWSQPELFKLDDMRHPATVAGVPPDYFSETGQLWGNPVYDWDEHRRQGYRWWLQRIARNLTLFDVVRLDHFRGFVQCWEVPATEKTATNGRWADVPTYDFFDTVSKRFHTVPFIAEDLGFITPDVREVIRHYGFPGMGVLLFAFGDDFPKSPFLPHHLNRQSVAYTGTHDNNTVCGWFETEASSQAKKRLFQYLGREVAAEDIHWEMIRMLMMSAADTVIFPMQDILGLGSDSRMNRPAGTAGNWQWRLDPGRLTPDLTRRLSQMVAIYARD